MVLTCRQPEQKNQPRSNLDNGRVIHAVIAVIKGERLLAAQGRGRVPVVDLVLRDAVPERAPGGLVVGDADQVARIPLFDQLGDGPGSEQRNIVRVGLHGGKHFPGMRLSGLAAGR